MLKLIGPEVGARIKSVEAGWLASKGKSVSRIATVTRLIGQWAERDKRILSQLGFYRKLWLARDVLGHHASKQQIAQLHALMMGGEEQDRTAIRDRLKSLDRIALVTRFLKITSAPGLPWGTSFSVALLEAPVQAISCCTAKF